MSSSQQQHRHHPRSSSLLSSLLFEYETPRIVNIHSKRIGCINRLLQLLIISYIVGVAIVIQKGYQDTCEVSSVVTTKVKGVAQSSSLLWGSSNDVSVDKNNSSSDDDEIVWDPVDYVTYLGDNGGFFVATSVVVTKGQVRGVCAESPWIKDSRCVKDSDCQPGYSSPVGNGVYTGKCVDSSLNGTKTCQVVAWCPVENEEDNPPHPLVDPYNATVLIKNVIEFQKFGPAFKRRNILESSNATYLQNCVYDPTTDAFCPIFKLRSIVEACSDDGNKNSSSALMSSFEKGGVIEIGIVWNCDLDWNFMEYCVPSYTFQRMDSPNALISPGWNFRSAHYHSETRRTLFKNYGIKFLVTVTGTGRKFNLVPLLINLGSGLALLGLARVFCDALVLNCMRNKEYYKKKKYLVVMGREDGMGRSSGTTLESTPYEDDVDDDDDEGENNDDDDVETQHQQLESHSTSTQNLLLH